jgi:hypothetical protein
MGWSIRSGTLTGFRQRWHDSGFFACYPFVEYWSSCPWSGASFGSVKGSNEISVCMNILLLIPGIISLVLVLRARIETAFLSVYLPTLLLLPEQYSLRLPHLPPFSTAQFALLPIGVVALGQLIRSRSFRLMDALVIMFVASVAITNILFQPVLNDGILAGVESFVSILLTYVTGRRLIEPDLRLQTVRRIVTLFLLTGPIGIYEWRMEQNPYEIFGQKFLGIIFGKGGAGVRNVFERAGGAFSNPEIEGIALGMTFALNSWLTFLSKMRRGAELGQILSKLEKFHIPGLVLILLIYFTGSRGPLISLAAGILILQISRVRYTKVATVAIVVLLFVGYQNAEQYFARLTDVSSHARMSSEVSSARYRRVMNEVYQPIAEQGGWLGWGPKVPLVMGMKSIDNEFLLIHLIQGELGYILILLICAESIRTAIARLWSFKASEDRVFACSMLAALAILWITLYTVYMGEQLPQYAFLLIGWGQCPVAGRTSALPVTGSNAWRARFSVGIQAENARTRG